MDIIIHNLQKKAPVSASALGFISKAVSETLAFEKVKKGGEITVCIVSDAQIRELNLQYLGLYRPTDVIAFNLSARRDKKIFADIIVSAQTARANAVKFKTSLLSEILLYVIHGTLHVLGHDDKTDAARSRMDKKSGQILSLLCPSIRPKH
jgi:probable rRNA maturation factor